MPRATRSAQAGLWDRVIDDPRFESDLEERDEALTAAKGVKACNERIDEHPEVMSLKKGERARCGTFVLTGTEFTRNEYTVKEAEAKRRVAISRLKPGQLE